MDDEFYLTLLSNSSMQYFPNNKTTQFCTQLPRSIQLEGEWVVALTEFQYPCTLLTVRKSENIIYFKEVVNQKMTEEKIRIETGNYDSVEDLISTLNTNSKLKAKGVSFNLNKASQKVSATFFKTSKLTSLKFSTYMALQLGFEPDQDVYKYNSGTHPSNIILGLPSQFFIYCDIIHPQIIGDTTAQLIRVVSIDNSRYMYGSQKMIIFSQPHYIPVLKREFENLEVHIRTETGENVPFQFGTVCVKLHFKRKKKNA